jgi:CspA family cold shock protein
MRRDAFRDWGKWRTHDEPPFIPADKRWGRASAERARASGTVKSFNDGFYCVACDDGGPDVFVHISAVGAAGLSGLEKGARLSFDVVNRK